MEQAKEEDTYISFCSCSERETVSPSRLDGLDHLKASSLLLLARHLLLPPPLLTSFFPHACMSRIA